jgi:alkanesulfonate monooxygenase SsuD/methylene tetrahydromethanopterin reductase-like flavin-dependent oxidoreductase (luciferase family)
MSRAEQAVRSGVEAVVQAISDRMVEALGLIGSARQVQRRLREFYEAGVEVPIVYPFAAGPGARAYRETIEALAERSGN